MRGRNDRLWTLAAGLLFASSRRFGGSSSAAQAAGEAPWYASFIAHYRGKPIRKPAPPPMPSGGWIVKEPTGPDPITTCLNESGRAVQEAKDAWARGDRPKAEERFRWAIHRADALAPEDQSSAIAYATYLLETGDIARMRQILGYSLGRWAASTGIENSELAIESLHLESAAPDVLAFVALTETFSGKSSTGLDRYLAGEIGASHTMSGMLESLFEAKRLRKFLALVHVADQRKDASAIALRLAVQMEPRNACANYSFGVIELERRNYASAAKRFDVARRFGTKSLKDNTIQKFFTASHLAKAWGPTGERRFMNRESATKKGLQKM